MRCSEADSACSVDKNRLSGKNSAAKMDNRYTLPNLPYDYAALEPHYSAKLLKLHHDKHHPPMVRAQTRPSRSSPRQGQRLQTLRTPRPGTIDGGAGVGVG